MLSSSLEDTVLLAQQFAKSVQPGQVLAFFGDLGAGKTTFIRSLAEAFCGIQPEQVTSPTFQYLNIYKGQNTIYHFDLYRLQNPDDFIHMGFDEMFHSNGITCIEWAERIEELLPEDTIRVKISHQDAQRRLVTIEAP